MHVFDLGVLQWLIGMVFRHVVDNNLLGAPHRYAMGRELNNIIGMNRRMKAYYRSMGPRERHRASRIGRLTLKMLGTRDKPRLHAKAAETRHLLGLAVQLTREHKDHFSASLPARFLARACREMKSFYDVMYVEKRRLSPGGLLALRSHMAYFLSSWKACGGHMYYKHHMAWHMVQRAETAGNPRFYHTFADEGENRAIGKVAKAVHGGRTFYKSVLQRVIADSL